MTQRMLTTRQAKMILFIAGYVDKNKAFPTIREIAKGCDINSSSIVFYNLGVLVDRGYVLKREGLSKRNRYALKEWNDE